jgi:hypothetical protein
MFRVQFPLAFFTRDRREHLRDCNLARENRAPWA